MASVLLYPVMRSAALLKLVMQNLSSTVKTPSATLSRMVAYQSTWAAGSQPTSKRDGAAGMRAFTIANRPLASSAHALR